MAGMTFSACCVSLLLLATAHATDWAERTPEGQHRRTALVLTGRAATQSASELAGAQALNSLEQLKQLERETLRKEISALPLFVSDEQVRIAQRENSAPDATQLDAPVAAVIPLAPEPLLRRGAPLAARARHVGDLLAAGNNVLSKERMVLSALTSEQTQIVRLATEFASKHGVRRAGARYMPIAAPDVLLPSVTEDVADDPVALSLQEAAVRAALVREEITMGQLVRNDESLEMQVSDMESKVQTADSDRSLLDLLRGESPEEVAWHDALRNILVGMAIILVCCPMGWALRGLIVLMILVIFFYFLLGRGFPAKLDYSMAIDWCLWTVALLYFNVLASVALHVLRENCCPPPAPAVAHAAPQLRRSVSGRMAGGAPGPNAGQNATDRQRVEENRRLAAEAVLRRALPIMMSIILLVLVLFLSGLIIFIEGWCIWARHHDDKCDQPLGTWLLISLSFPAMFVCLNVGAEQAWIYNVFNGALIGMGFNFWSSTKTCHETSPELHHFVQLYLLYYLLVWTTYLCMFGGAVGLAMWLQQSGLIDGQQQPGKPGLIEELRDVEFAPGMSPNECSICQEQFAADGKVIKRTPCNHTFHKDCLAEWLEKWNRTCPLCRNDLEEALDLEAMAEPEGEFAGQGA